MAPLAGDPTWVVSAALVNDGITVWCHQSGPTPCTLGAPRFVASVTDEVGTAYRSTGGGGGGIMEQLGYQFDFRPRPPPDARIIRFAGRLDGGPEVHVEFALTSATRHAPGGLRAAFATSADLPRFVAPCRLVVDPDGTHPVHLFGIEAWTRHTVLWAVWKSERGARYVLFAGGCRHPMGHNLGNTPPGLSAARIHLPFVLPDGAESLDVTIRLRGEPGHESTGAIPLPR